VFYEISSQNKWRNSFGSLAVIAATDEPIVSNMKGKIMTTENTVTTEAPTPQQIAEDFVKEHSINDVVEHLLDDYNTIERLKQRLQSESESNDLLRANLRDKMDTIEEFLKSHIAENDSASVDELKELAESLSIELTKEIEITFTAEVTATATVPLDFDPNKFDDSDFDVRVEYIGNFTDVDCDDIDVSTDGFEAEEK
jgi:ribosome-binding protein aMBF1 (putative translation factor)